MTTGDAVLARLAQYDVKKDSTGEYRFNSPFRAGANSHSCSLTIDGDGEHGAWQDFNGGDKGSLYELANRLGVAVEGKSERVQVDDSKRAYKNLAEYAALKGVPEEVFLTAKWSKETVTYDKRPAFEFPTQGGKRYRFADGNKPAFKSQVGYTACWYGLTRALELAKEQHTALVIVNGEPSTVVGLHFKVPACCITGGEQPTIPAHLLAQLKEVWAGEIWLALDCDEAGRKAAAGKANLLRAAGFTVTVLDLRLSEKGDLADHCKLHTDSSLDALTKLAQDAPKTDLKGASSNAAPNNAIPVVKRSERLSSYNTRLYDYDAPRTAVPIPFPMRVLHELGGMAQVMKPGKMMGVVGVSGGGKTSLVETLVDLWLPFHVPSLVWSPEWTPDEFVERAVQRYDGPRTDELYRHEIFIDEQQRGIKDGFGRELNAEQLQKASKAIAKLRAFESEVGYLDMPMLTVAHLQNAIDNTLRSIDFKPRVLVIDYIQLMAALEPGNTTLYDQLMRIKAVGNSFGLIPVLASQVTKNSAKGQQNGRALDAMDARYVNDDAFNLFITINPDRTKHGDYLPAAVLNVAKNSLGQRGKVRVPADWARLTFTDAKHFNQRFDDSDTAVPF